MSERLDNLRYAFERGLGRRFTEGNALEILRNGDQIFPAMLGAIGEAQDSVDFLTFVYWSGDIAKKFAAELSEAARRGLKVRVLLDGYGARSISEDHLRQMEDAGAEIRWFRPLHWWQMTKSTHRTHRKVLICDERVAFTGGVGIAEEWEGDARDSNEWRDTHFKIRGPAVLGLLSAFGDNWLEAGGTDLNPPRPVPYGHEGEVPLLALRSHSAVGWNEIGMVTHLLIERARKKLILVTAYFVINDYETSLLCEAAQRGVDVQVLLPGPHIDKQFVRYAHVRHFGELLHAGVKIRIFLPSMLHAKIILLDDQMACVGSANLNQRSLKRDEEVCLLIDHKPTVATLNQHYEEDCKRSYVYDLDALHSRSLRDRLMENLLLPFRPHT